MYRNCLLLSMILLSSCFSANDIVEEVKPVNVQVKCSGFEVKMSALTRATSTQIPDNVNRCAISVFNSEGVAVASFVQKKETPAEAVLTGGASLGTTTAFGSSVFTLAPGDYTFVCILNEAVASDATAQLAIAPATISTKDIATIPGVAVHDTYCCSQAVSIKSTTKSVSLSMGSRINSRFTLTVSDNVPAGVRYVRLAITPDGKSSYTNHEINPSTGLETSPINIHGLKEVTAGSAVPEVSMDLYITEKPFNTRVSIEGLDASKKSLYTRTIENVPFNQNNITHATGSLFDPISCSDSFTFNSTDWTSTSVSF